MRKISRRWKRAAVAAGLTVALCGTGIGAVYAIDGVATGGTGTFSASGITYYDTSTINAYQGQVFAYSDIWNPYGTLPANCAALDARLFYSSGTMHHESGYLSNGSSYAAGMHFVVSSGALNASGSWYSWGVARGGCNSSSWSYNYTFQSPVRSS